MKPPGRRRLGRRYTYQIWPDHPRRGQVRSFYEAVGRSLAAWQHVEAGLYEVYRALAASRRPGAEAAAFHAVEMFSAQLRMTDKAARFVFHDTKDKKSVEMLKKWVSLRNRATKKSEKRNDIVHQYCYIEFIEPDKERRIYLRPSMNNPFFNQTDIYTAKRIRELTKDFQKLSKDLFAFSRIIPEP